jgi:uncharacterized protein with von Willebrand factor type A (vWA) domain
MWSDFHGVGFLPDPILAETCADPLRQKFVAALLENPEMQSLRLSTVLNQVASELAAVEFGEEFLKFQQEQKEKKSGEGDEEDDGECEAAAGKAAAGKAAARAMEKAEKEVEGLENAVRAGMGEGEPGKPLDPKRVAELFRRVRGSEVLKKITELAGRFRRVAQSKQRLKRHGYEDMVGVCLDDRAEAMLSEEAMLFTVPEFELDAMRRLMEHETLCHEYRTNEPVGKGPIIICVDESGSMRGAKVEAAKAFALSMAWIARRQRRWCALVAYTGAVEIKGKYGPGVRILPLTENGKWNEGELLNWLEQFMGMGSDIDVPVREMPQIYTDLKAPVGATDVIFVTDAECYLPAGIVKSFNTWKKSVNARLISLVIGCSDGASLKEVSNEVYCLKNLEADSEAVGACLSI